MKRVVALSGAAVLLGMLLFSGGAVATTGGSGCQLSGSANLSPGLTSTAQNFTYSFSGTLSNCQASEAAPGGGTVFAGTNGLPRPAGNGSCDNSTTSGTAVAQWSDGTTTVFSYTTTGAAAAVVLQGSVVASITSSTGTTYTTTRFAGDNALGALAFEPPDPTACSGAGVTTAGIDGFVGVGNTS